MYSFVRSVIPTTLIPCFSAQAFPSEDCLAFIDASDAFEEVLSDKNNRLNYFNRFVFKNYAARPNNARISAKNAEIISKTFLTISRILPTIRRVSLATTPAT